MSIDLDDLLHYRVTNSGYFTFKELKEYLDPLKFDEEKYEYYKPLCENIKLVCWNIYKGGIFTFESVDLLHMLKCKEIFDSWLNITGNKNRIIDVGTTEEAERKKQTERMTLEGKSNEEYEKQPNKELTDKQYKLISKIKKEGAKILERNPTHTKSAIALDLSDKEPFKRYSVETLRKYYSTTYSHRGKIIK